MRIARLLRDIRKCAAHLCRIPLVAAGKHRCRRISALARCHQALCNALQLRKAHQANDRAVMQAYGFDIKTTTEASCVAELMKMYQKLTE